MGRNAKLDFQVHEKAISSVEVIRFLKHLLRHIPGKLLLVWEGARIHRSKAVQQFLTEGAQGRIHLEPFPA